MVYYRVFFSVFKNIRQKIDGTVQILLLWLQGLQDLDVDIPLYQLPAAIHLLCLLTVFATWNKFHCFYRVLESMHTEQCKAINKGSKLTQNWLYTTAIAAALNHLLNPV